MLQGIWGQQWSLQSTKIAHLPIVLSTITLFWKQVQEGLTYIQATKSEDLVAEISTKFVNKSTLVNQWERFHCLAVCKCLIKGMKESMGCPAFQTQCGQVSLSWDIWKIATVQLVSWQTRQAKDHADIGQTKSCFGYFSKLWTYANPSLSPICHFFKQKSRHELA